MRRLRMHPRRRLPQIPLQTPRQETTSSTKEEHTVNLSDANKMAHQMDREGISEWMIFVRSRVKNNSQN